MSYIFFKTSLNNKRPKYPCWICAKACKTGCITCDDCDTWLHKECFGMSTTELSNIGHSEATWTCPSCSKANSSRLYSTPDEDTSHSNTAASIGAADLSTHPSHFDSVSDISLPSRSSISNDIFTDQPFASTDEPMSSSPKPGRISRPKRKSLRALLINCQSLREKGKLLEAVIMDTDPI